MRAARTRGISAGTPSLALDILSHNTINFEEMIDSKLVNIFKLSAFILRKQKDYRYNYSQ